jgi:hypothetical protein
MDVSKPSKGAYACESGKPGRNSPVSVFFGGATEFSVNRYGSVNGSMKTGYYLGKDRRLMKWLDAVNYNNVDRTVYIYNELEFLPGKPEGYIDSGIQLIDPGMCGGSQGTIIHPPKGVQKFKVNSTGIVAASDGYISSMSMYTKSSNFNRGFIVLTLGNNSWPSPW